MTRCLGKRLLRLMTTLLGVAGVVFVLGRVLPGDGVGMRVACGQDPV